MIIKKVNTFFGINKLSSTNLQSILLFLKKFLITLTLQFFVVVLSLNWLNHHLITLILEQFLGGNEATSTNHLFRQKRVYQIIFPGFIWQSYSFLRMDVFYPHLNAINYKKNKGIKDNLEKKKCRYFNICLEEVEEDVIHLIKSERRKKSGTWGQASILIKGIMRTDE